VDLVFAASGGPTFGPPFGALAPEGPLSDIARRGLPAETIRLTIRQMGSQANLARDEIERNAKGERVAVLGEALAR
jgi:hypothetical protein